MLPDERARQVRDRAFQDRVLAALEKRRRSRTLTILNSPIFLWIMSLLVITCGSAYYSNFKECIGNSKQLIRSYRDIRSEIISRQMSIGAKLLFAHTVADARAAVLNVGSDNGDFRNQRLDELMIRLETMPIRNAIADSGMNPLTTSLRSYDETIRSTPALAKFAPLTFGQFPVSLSPADLSSLQVFGYAMFRRAVLEAVNDVPILTTIDCGGRNIFKMLLGGEPQTVRMTRVSFLEFQKARDLLLRGQ